MPDRSGVTIYNRFYPWPTTVRVGDPTLVTEITGMTWPDFLTQQHEWIEASADAKEMGLEPPEMDAVVFAGMVALAFWQGNTTMTRSRARRAIERVPIEEIEVVDGDDMEDDLGPPASGGNEAAVHQESTSTNESGSSPEHDTRIPAPASSWDETNPNGSGIPPSPTTSPESLPA